MPVSRTRRTRTRIPTIRSTRFRLQDAVTRVPVSIPQEFTINMLGGFNNVGFDVVFAIRQRDVVYSISGSPYLATLPFNNAASLANVFDEYRVVDAKQRILFNKNSAGLELAYGSALLYGVVDYTDGNPLNGVGQALAYGNHRIMNLGMDNRNGEHSIYGGKLGVQYSVDSTTPSGVRTLGVTKRAPWCRTEVTDVEHNGFKYFLDPSSTADTTIGVVTFITTLIIEYRQLH